ncbi:MAG TPA: DUF1002 domain-containing protein [Candidatus Blautia excrementipullorum]|nr:DUF1002 domain-containing protein [Candidatus Blautia excrementipullorum]
MKKRSVIAALLCSMCLTVGSTFPVMADSAKVVTLGADLTQDQKNTMMNYFKADASQVQILTVTNADEREYLGNYIPLEQIGTRTLSCAYVKPTQSGGIKVRTANLNYVTGRMIANALSTAGISNCEAVAACPYEVSGTGALTGVMMAYESASGQKLDSTKKDLATQEVVVTGNLAQQVGEDNATNIINQAKLQIIGQNVQNADEIYNIVNNIAVENNVTFSSEEMDAIVSLLQQIAQQSYDIEQMKTTLEEIQESIDKEDDPQATETPAPEEGQDAEGEDADEEDITQNVDPGVLGDDIKESSTEDPSLAEETMGDSTENAGDSSAEEETGIPEATDDGTIPEATDDGTIPEATEDGSMAEGDGTEQSADETGIPEATDDGTIPEATEDGSMAEGDGTEQSVDETGIPEATDDGTIPEATEDGSMAEGDGTDQYTEETVIPEGDGTDQAADGTIPEASADGTETADTFNTDSLGDEAKSRFENARTFCAGEYEGDAASLQAATGDPAAAASAVIDSATGSALTQKVLEAYLSVLQDGGMSYVPSGTEQYMSSELNMMDSKLKEIFSINTEPAADDILASQTPDTRQALYNDTVKFLAGLYGETVPAEDTSAETVPAEEGTGEQVYTEEAVY